MKRIVCELCEGTEFTKENGMFVCQGCGTKYSAEEARSLMRDVEGDAPASTGIPVVGVSMVNPNQTQIDNMLLLATNAFEAGNLKEAESYCNQVIALDAMSYKAWFLKGKAAGWQSTLASLRITEAAHSFGQAIDFAPEEEKEDVKEQTMEELQKLGIACITLRKDKFVKYPDKEELEGFDHDQKELLSALSVLLSKGTVVDIPEEYQEQISTLMYKAGDEGFSMARDQFNSKSRPDRNDFSRTIEAADNCAELITKSMTISHDEEAMIPKYEKIISIYKYTIDLRAYTDYNSHTPDWVLTDHAKKVRRDWISAAEMVREKIKSIVSEKKKARIEAYWEAHTEEKAALEAEKKQLTEKKVALDSEIAELNKTISAYKAEEKAKVPSEEETDKLKNQIRELENRRAKLGMFSGKEKNRITEEIATLQGRIDSLKDKIEKEKKAKAADVQEKLAPIQSKRNELDSERAVATKRLSAIDTELTKDPKE